MTSSACFKCCSLTITDGGVTVQPCQKHAQNVASVNVKLSYYYMWPFNLILPEITCDVELLPSKTTREWYANIREKMNEYPVVANWSLRNAKGESLLRCQKCIYLNQWSTSFRRLI
jgi:hypothetical protein